MTPEDAFLADIREHPDDDTSRLIFADWLEDNGDSDRAEFIRARVYRARISDRDSPEAVERDGRAAALLAANWQRWTEPLRTLFGESPGFLNWHRARFRPEAISRFPRGFVEAAEMQTGRFVEVAADLFEACPIRQLHLHQADDHAPALAACPQLAWVESLHFDDYYRAPLGPRAMACLAKSPHLERLWMLGLFRNHLGDDGASALATASWLDGLRWVILTDNGLSARGIAALTDTTRAFRPEQLMLDHNPIGDEGAIALAGSPILREVRVLSLASCLVGSAGAAALARSPHLQAVEEVDLRGNDLTWFGEANLRAAPWGARVKLS